MKYLLGLLQTRDPALVVLALIVVVFTISGLLVSLLYSVPYAVRRVKRYPEPGSARRLFALSALVSIAIPTACLALFLATGFVALFVEDSDIRAAISRALLVAGIVLLSLLVIVTPIGHRYTELAADREARESVRAADDRESRQDARESRQDAREAKQDEGG